MAKHRRGHYDARQETRDMQRLTNDPGLMERGYLLTWGRHMAERPLSEIRIGPVAS